MTDFSCAATSPLLHSDCRAVSGIVSGLLFLSPAVPFLFPPLSVIIRLSFEHVTIAIRVSSEVMAPDYEKAGGY